MEIDARNTALVVTDPQNDVLSDTGVAWALVGDSIRENKTVEHIEQLFAAAKANGYDVFISPHYYYPADQEWLSGGAVETMMQETRMFGRVGPLDLDGFRGSGADWLERYKPYIEDGRTIVASPHKIYGPETNDLVVQLRKRGKSRVVLAGMLANLCVESHLRELIEQGFEVAVVKDATAAPRHPQLGDGYQPVKRTEFLGRPHFLGGWGSMGRPSRFSPEVRERAIRMVEEHRENHASEWAVLQSVAPKLGCTAETLRKWVRQAQRDTGHRPGLTTSERERLKALEREVRELKRANEILRKASAYFAQAELDRRSK